MFDFVNNVFYRKRVKTARKDKSSLGNILLKAGIVSEEQLKNALMFQDKNKDEMLGDVLIKLDMVSRPMIEEFLILQKTKRGTQADVIEIARYANKNMARLRRKHEESRVVAMNIMENKC